MRAVEAVRRMRGGAQSQLILCSDKRLWIVKFQNNPQGIRVLANEWIASRLAGSIGLSVPEIDIVDVSEAMARDEPGMFIEMPREREERYLPGQHFGSALVGGLMPGLVVDYLPERLLPNVRNLSQFAGVLAFDKWAGNCDGRQAVFQRAANERHYRAAFIDHGFCFNCQEWNFPDSPLRGVYARNSVYAGVTGWASFDPWLSRIEDMSLATLLEIAQEVPPLWYGGNKTHIEALMKQLMNRRSRVRELISAFRNSEREPFPHWTD